MLFFEKLLLGELNDWIVKEKMNSTRRSMRRKMILVKQYI